MLYSLHNDSKDRATSCEADTALSGSFQALWIHTGAACYELCDDDCHPFSSSGQDLDPMTFDDVKPFVDRAVGQGVEQFSFTGGEPFSIPDLVRILDYALEFRPCLVLTSGTLQSRIDQAFSLIEKKHELTFCINLDYPDIQKHNAVRGEGSFEAALETLSELYSAGFNVSVARCHEEGERSMKVDAAYRPFFEQVDLAPETPIISFPERVRGSYEITSTTKHELENVLAAASSRMIVKQKGAVSTYALIDDDSNHDGQPRNETSGLRMMLSHRCATGAF